MRSINKIIMTFLGLVLIAAAILKAHQILTTVIPTYQQIAEQYSGFEFIMRVLECREVMIFHVPAELALGIWLISGIFRRLAWLAGLITFIFFAFVTAYKVLNGYADCGCFGTIKIEPRITLYLVDIPAVILLAIFYPRGQKWIKLPSLKYLLWVGIPSFLVIVVLTVYLLSAPAVEPEPTEKAGTRWEKLDHIHSGEKLSDGMWVVMMFHYNCPDCKEAIPYYQNIAPDFEGSINFAFIEIPPYGDLSGLGLDDESSVLVDSLDQSKDWIIQTPRTLLLVDGTVIKSWDGEAPTIDEIFESMQ